jgi:hypothetical protein
MTTDKARKRTVRARMAKTGERYSAARRNTVKPAPFATDDLGQSDQAIRRATGKGWTQWIRLLDDWGATAKTHTEIARHVSIELGVDGWWAQTVTVGYERARGMRAKHQRPDGFSVSVSKTVPVDVHTLWRAFTDTRARNRWLERGTLRLRTAQDDRTARFDVAGGGIAAAGFTPKGPAKASVAIGFERLPDQAAVETTRAVWRERLATLTEHLATPR